MGTRPLVLTLLIISLRQSALTADDWPQWRGPNRGDGDRRPKRTGGGAEGRVYVSDRVTEPEEIERVHCFRWSDGLQSLMCTPYLSDGYVYGVNRYGVLRCLDAGTGDRIWEDHTAASQVDFGTLHIVRGSNNIWIFNDRGELIIGRLSPEGFEDISRAKLIKPTTGQLRRRDGVTWSHPAFAYKHVFIRNDEELVCASLDAGTASQ